MFATVRSISERQDDGGDDSIDHTDPGSLDLGQLYERYHASVFSYVYARLGNRDDAADLTQQIFLKVIARIDTYQERGSGFSPWLFRIAQNSVTDFLRRRRPTQPLHLLPSRLEPVAASDPEADVLRAESTEKLRRHIRSLAARDRDLLALRFAAGLRVREIAAVTGKSEGATRKYLLRLLHSLREYGDE
jgi:RNA polymerase sigma-70 factor (ECF subfamily)